MDEGFEMDLGSVKETLLIHLPNLSDIPCLPWRKLSVKVLMGLKVTLVPGNNV